MFQKANVFIVMMEIGELPIRKDADLGLVSKN